MYRFRHEHAIARMAKVIEVSESGYYKWKNAQKAQTLRQIENMRLSKEIGKIYDQSKAVYGIRKVTAELNFQRQKVGKSPVNHKRVERIMRENHWHSRVRRKFIVTTDSSKTRKPAENLLQRDFVAKQPGEKFISDTTYVPTPQGTLYVAVILDLYGRYPLGLAMSTKNNKQLVMDCLDDALARHTLKPGCIGHSDRGSTYASEDYQKLLRKNDIRCSMSKKGDCWDNAAMESFFGKMKTEWLYQMPLTIREARKLIYEYVWAFYAKERRHAANGYQTPYEVYYG